MQNDVDSVAVAGKGLVDGVVGNLPQQVAKASAGG